MRKSSLYASLPLPSIPSELPPSPCAEKVYAFSDCHIYEYDFSGISNDYNGFTTSKIALTFTFPLSMLIDRAGCYNVREEKLIVRQLTSTVNSYGIATFSVRGEGLRFFDFRKYIEYDFPEFQIRGMVL